MIYSIISVEVLEVYLVVDKEHEIFSDVFKTNEL